MSNCFVTASKSIKQKWEINKFIFFLKNLLIQIDCKTIRRTKRRGEAENGGRDWGETHALRASEARAQTGVRL